MIYETDFQKTIEDAFLLYGASVAQERAIPDVRDGLKIGLRQGMYAQFTNGLTYEDKYQKAQKSVASAMAQSYVHGDAAMYDTLIRAAKPWVYRYPIESVQGSYGDPCAPDNHSAARYVEMKAGELADYMFDGLKKNAVDVWYNNYDDTELIPSVFPSIGFWNIVNGCTGIAVALTTSVPQFNLKEVNDALIKIIKNPDVEFDEIYCAPDFAQGSTIINGAEVKKLLKKGEGGSIRLRAKLEYIPEQNMIRATEMPFGVFTNTIIEQLKELTDNDENYGIDRVIDHTKTNADVRIYLRRGANPKKMINKLYRDTSLENYFAVNMTMLDKGCFPKVFGWRQACNAYIKHIRKCKKNEYKYEFDKSSARKNVVDGLIIAVADIDNVVNIIKAAKSVTEAEKAIMTKYGLNDDQIRAILAMKLSALTKMDSDKLKNEQKELEKQIAEINDILMNPDKLDAKLIEILKNVAKKFGDDRRTEVTDLKTEIVELDVEEQNLAVMLFDNNMFRVVFAEDMVGTKKGRKGLSVKPPKGANLINTIYTTNKGSVSCFTNKGKVYSFEMADLECEIDYGISEVIRVQDGENVINIIDGTQFHTFKDVIFITKSGLIKKTPVSEYTTTKGGIIAIKLKPNDEIINVFLSANEEDEIMIVSSSGNYVRFQQGEILETGRSTFGVKAIQLKKDAYVTDATIIYKNIKYLGVFTVVNNGKGKITDLSDLTPTSRASQGPLAHRMDKTEILLMAHAVPDTQEKINIIVDSKLISIDVKEIPVQGKLTSGVKVIDAEDTEFKHLTYC